MTVFAVEYVYDPEAADLLQEHRPAHRAWLKSLVEEGRLLASGPFTDGSGALLLFVAEDDDELHGLIAQDPLAPHKVISGLRSTPWQPVIGPFTQYA